MTEGNGIRYLRHHEIDLSKWDRCIRQASNGMIYALSDYLEAMAPGWEALIYKDYEAVFPLPVRKKFGWHYIFQPILVAELGLFGNDLTPGLTDRFLDAIPSKFRYIDLPLNYQNRSERKEVYTRQNFALQLNRDYNDIYDGFNKNVKRNILKAERQHCEIDADTDISNVTALSMKHIGDAKALRAFEKLFRFFRDQGQAKAYAVRHGNEVIAAAAFLFSHDRAYYVLAGNHDDSRSRGASHSLINAFIKDHARKNILLDFEGSDVPGLAQYYASFGAVPDPYAAVRWNRLPLLLKWLKRS